MNLERFVVETEQRAIPAVMVRPSTVRGAALVLHGYGGNKEEILGFASRVAAVGLATCAIDLCGHGQNASAMSAGAVEAEVESALAQLRRWGKVAAIGHSLGGRLALCSSADVAIGISPALAVEYSPVTRKVIDDLRSYRVREAAPGVNFELLRRWPEWRPGSRPAALVFWARDVPEIAAACRALKGSGAADVTEIPLAYHGDIINLEATFECVESHLRGWF